MSTEIARKLVGNDGVIVLVAGDITTMAADAIFNAANAELAGGGGVDGAIHRAGGSAIMEELQSRYHGCDTGSAVATGAGKLAARYVIHAVGPRWRGGTQHESVQLKSAYMTAFSIANERGCRTILSPSISTGIYGFPVREAAVIAVTAAQIALEAPGNAISTVTFVLRSEDHVLAFHNALFGTSMRPEERADQQE